MLMLHSLFGALPIKDAYGQSGTKRTVTTTGVYALCRHPGVLWFVLLFAALHFAFGIDPTFAALLSLLNILLALFEDVLVFPAVLDGYQSYKTKTPFLIPSAGSIRRCLQHYGKR